MRKFFILLIVLILSGCGHLGEQSEFWKHKSIYASGGHAGFSIFSWRNPDVGDVQDTGREGWWGIPVEVKVKSKDVR